MGNNESEVITYDRITTENINDLRYQVIEDTLLLGYYYSASKESGANIFHEEKLKLSNVDALKMDLFVCTILNRYDCVNLAEHIWKNMKCEFK